MNSRASAVDSDTCLRAAFPTLSTRSRASAGGERGLLARRVFYAVNQLARQLLLGSPGEDSVGLPPKLSLEPMSNQIPGTRHV